MPPGPAPPGIMTPVSDARQGLSSQELPGVAREGLERLAPQARRVLVAVSGGADSVALLCALRSAGIDLVVGHLDHALRDGSAEDAAFVRSLARRQGVEAAVERIAVAEVAKARGWNLEDAGRRLRYEMLARAARRLGCDVIATAHHRDDQAETVLAQLLRGSAHPVGIAPRRERVVRPLLEVPREALRRYLERLEQPWREDPANRALERTRNWLRHELLPRLERQRPGAAARLARFAALQRDQAAFLADEARRRFGDGPLARSALARAPLALQREALARLLRRAGADPEAEHLEGLIEAVAAAGSTRRDLPGGVRVRVLHDRVDAVPRPEAEAAVEWAAEGAAPRPAGSTGAALVDRPDRLPAGLPPELLRDGPLELRPRRPGDRIRLPGGGKKVADLLVERKVPREARDALRVLARGEDVLWVEGVAVAAGLPEEAVDPELPWMRRALALADRAGAEGELPVGAVVIRDGVLLGEGWNRREGRADPLAHAEAEALRAAAGEVGSWRLSGATLLVTLEPCPMCVGAVLQSHVERIVYGAVNRRDGALGSVADVAAAPWKRRLEVRGGLLEAEARRRLERFFAERR